MNCAVYAHNVRTKLGSKSHWRNSSENKSWNVSRCNVIDGRAILNRWPMRFHPVNMWRPYQHSQTHYHMHRLDLLAHTLQLLLLIVPVAMRIPLNCPPPLNCNKVKSFHTQLHQIVFSWAHHNCSNWISLCRNLLEQQRLPFNHMHTRRQHPLHQVYQRWAVP